MQKELDVRRYLTEPILLREMDLIMLDRLRASCRCVLRTAQQFFADAREQRRCRMNLSRVGLLHGGL